MSLSSRDIKLLFICEPSEAINECHNIICSASNFSSFQEFYNYHLKNSHVSTCQNEWSTNTQMSIHCDDCSSVSNSCYCLQCFLNGNHQGHNYIVNTNSQGNCDCGDSSLLKQSGFCIHHHGLENDSHPEDYLDEKLRTALTDIVFKGALSAIKHLTEDDGSNIQPIFQFLKSFLKFGDGFRRLIVISLTERINFDKLFDSIFEATYEFNLQLQQFCGLLINDQLFKNKFGPVNYRLMLNKLIPGGFNVMATGISQKNILPWKSFWFHSYQKDTIKNSIDENKLNLIEFTTKVLHKMKDLFIYLGKPIREIPQFFVEYLVDGMRFLSDEEIQNFFDIVFTQVLTSGSEVGRQIGVNDTIIPTCFTDEVEAKYFRYVHSFNVNFFDCIEAFKSKKNLKLDKMFDELNNIIDITPIYMIGKNENGSENDKFLSSFINLPKTSELVKSDDYYKSFQKGGSFFISHPMFYSLAFLIRNDNLCRVKIARLMSNEKYQSLRVQLGIITVKNLLALICVHQTLVPGSNESAFNLLLNFTRNEKVFGYGIPLMFPLLQLLVGLQCNSFGLKEFYAFEIAREIGILDENNGMNDEKMKKMIFSFLYLSILLAVERTLFNFDGYKYIKEQIIFELKKGVSDLNKLKNSLDINIHSSLNSSSVLYRIISEVSTSRQKNKKSKNENSDQDMTFELKEGIEYNYFSAINSFNYQKTIMNEEISKHPESLIKIPQFEPEETYFFHQNQEEEIDTSGLNIRLKEFLFTPSVLAIVYKTLRKDDSESSKTELNDHLAMNILVLVSKFIQETNENASEEELSFENIHYNSSIVDLISQLRRVVFNYNSDEKSTLQNTLNRKTFNSLMKTKISSETEAPKSFVDLILEKGELGKNVLTQMSVEIENVGNEKEKQDMNKMKKIRAQKMKEEIMSHFKTITTNFHKNEDDEDDDDNEANEEASSTPSNTDKEICSICSSTIKNEVLSYPLYIYRTKFPFIIDKPPLVEMPVRIAIKETEVYKDQDILLSTVLGIDDDNDDDDEDNIPDPDELFAHFLSQMPGLDISNGMSEQEIQERRSAIESMHNRLVDQINRLKEEQEQRRKQREKDKLLRIQSAKEEMARIEKELKNSDMIVSKQVTPGNLFVIQFGICQHLVHPNCVNKNDFTCPIDRSFKNGFLPNIDDLQEDVIFADKENFDLSNELKESLNLFISKYSMFFKPPEDIIVDVFVELVKSLSGLISTYEVRLRSLPDCLDSKKTKLLSRNLFLATWYAYRMKGKPAMKTGFSSDVSEDVDSKFTVFQRFVKKLIECDEIEGGDISRKNQALQGIISSFKESSSSLFKGEKEFCLFLRRVCLADHFLLKQNNNNNKEEEESKFIDWDEIISVTNLSQKFDVVFKAEEFEFKPFIFSKMPKEFLRFSQDPYNFPVDQTQHYFIFNVLNYNYMIQNYNDLDDEEENNMQIDYMNDFTELDGRILNLQLHKIFSNLNYPSVILCIGRESSNVCVIDGKRIKFLRPFFLDKYGCADIGFRRKQPLFLNEERYERVMDQILSGDFTNGLNLF